MHTALDIVSDAAVVGSGDGLGIADIVAGIPATIEGIVASSNKNTNVSTYTSYPAKSKGIQVSVSSIYPISLTSGDNQSLMYSATPATNWGMPWLFQNDVFITTFRQQPINTGSGERNSADTLFITVINEGVSASNQLQQYINSPNSASMVGGAKYTPTKEQAQDSLKILTILTLLSKDRPQDAKTIIDMFGISGKYRAIKNDPNAMSKFNLELKAIFERYKKEVPDVERYLANLARK
jgi:hypothetical protein